MAKANRGLCALHANEKVNGSMKSIGLEPMPFMGECRVCGVPTAMAEQPKGKLSPWHRKSVGKAVEIEVEPEEDEEE